MRHLAHDVQLREKIADEEGLVFIEGMVNVPQDLPVIGKGDVLASGDWYVEHEVSLPSGHWVQIVKSPLSMETALEMLCGLAKTNMVLVEDEDVLAAPADYYTMMSRGYDDKQQYHARRYQPGTAYRIRNFKTSETIMGDML